LQKAHNQLLEEHKLQIGEVRAAKENAFESDKQLHTLSRDYEQAKQEVGLGSLDICYNLCLHRN